MSRFPPLDTFLSSKQTPKGRRHLSIFLQWKALLSSPLGIHSLMKPGCLCVGFPTVGNLLIASRTGTGKKHPAGHAGLADQELQAYSLLSIYHLWNAVLLISCRPLWLLPGDCSVAPGGRDKQGLRLTVCGTGFTMQEHVSWHCWHLTCAFFSPLPSSPPLDRILMWS